MTFRAVYTSDERFAFVSVLEASGDMNVLSDRRTGRRCARVAFNEFNFALNPVHRRWWILGFPDPVCLIGLVAGSLAPLLSDIGIDLNMSRIHRATLGAWPFVYLAVSTFAGKFGPLRRSVGLTLGAVLIGASGLLRAAAQSGLGLWLAVAILGLEDRLFQSGLQVGYEWFFSEERGLTVGLAQLPHGCNHGTPSLKPLRLSLDIGGGS